MEPMDKGASRPKIPIELANKSKEELEQYCLKLLKKLKQSDLKLKEVTEKGPEQSDGEQKVQQVKQDNELLKAELVAERQQHKDVAGKLSGALEREALYQEQLSSLKEALKVMAEEREAAFARISEERETAQDLSEALHQANSTVGKVSRELEDTRREVAVLREEQVKAKEVAELLEVARKEEMEARSEIKEWRQKLRETEMVMDDIVVLRETVVVMEGQMEKLREELTSREVEVKQLRDEKELLGAQDKQLEDLSAIGDHGSCEAPYQPLAVVLHIGDGARQDQGVLEEQYLSASKEVAVLRERCTALEGLLRANSGSAGHLPEGDGEGAAAGLRYCEQAGDGGQVDGDVCPEVQPVIVHFVLGSGTEPSETTRSLPMDEAHDDDLGTNMALGGAEKELQSLVLQLSQERDTVSSLHDSVSMELQKRLRELAVQKDAVIRLEAALQDAHQVQDLLRDQVAEMESSFYQVAAKKEQYEQQVDRLQQEIEEAAVEREEVEGELMRMRDVLGRSSKALRSVLDPEDQKVLLGPPLEQEGEDHLSASGAGAGGSGGVGHTVHVDQLSWLQDQLRSCTEDLQKSLGNYRFQEDNDDDLRQQDLRSDEKEGPSPASGGDLAADNVEVSGDVTKLLQQLCRELQSAVEDVGKALGMLSIQNGPRQVEAKEEQCRYEVERLTAELKCADERCSVMMREQQDDYHRSIQQLEEQVSTMRGYEQEVQVLKEALAAANRQLMEATTELDAVRMENRVALQRAEQGQQHEVAARQQIEAQMTEAREASTKMGEELKTKSTAIDHLTSELTSLRNEIELMKQQHDKEMEKKSKEVGDKEGEVQHLTAEKNKMVRVVEDLKKRAAKALKAKQEAELRAEEQRSQLEAEREGARLELQAVEQQLTMNQKELERVEMDLKEYKVRAQALLRAKDSEVATAKQEAVAAAQGYGGAAADKLRQLNDELQMALQKNAQLETDLAAALRDSQIDITRATSALENQVHQLQMSLEYYQHLAEASQRELEDKKRRCDQVERQLQQQQLSNKQSHMAELEVKAKDLEDSLQKLSYQLKHAQEELKSQRQTSESMIEAKDSEVLALLRKNALLQEELVLVRQQLGTAATPRSHSMGRLLAGNFLTAAADCGCDTPGNEVLFDGQPSLSRQSCSSAVTTPRHVMSRRQADMNPWSLRSNASDADLLESILSSGDEVRPQQHEQQLVALAARQAQRDDELATARQRVAELEQELMDMEGEMRLREEMESTLKETLREIEREQRRQSKGGSAVDMEYLKNTLMKLFCTGEAEALLPVVATILSFSPQEVRQCRDGIEAVKLGEVPLPGAAAAVDSTASVLGNLGSWLPSWGFSSGGETPMATTPTRTKASPFS